MRGQIMIIRKQKRMPHNLRDKHDRGTPEIQKKRALILERNDTENTFLAESLLGIFYGRRLISQPLYEAGHFFGELRYRYTFCLERKFRHYSSSLCYERVDGLSSSTAF